MRQLLLIGLVALALAGCSGNRVFWNTNGQMSGKNSGDRKVWDTNGKVKSPDKRIFWDTNGKMDQKNRKIWDNAEGQPVIK